MGQFLGGLKDLQSSMNLGLDAGTASAFLDRLLGEREDRRTARREEQQAAMEAMAKLESGVLGLATTEAQQGTTLPQLAALASAKFGQQMSPEQLYGLPGIQGLYLPTGQEGYTHNAGQSRINPTLNPDDVADIQRMIVVDEASDDDVYATLQQLYGPETFNRLLPELNKAISAARTIQKRV